MFRILIKDLNLYGYHGVLEKEKRIGQNFLFNVEVYLKKESFTDSDNIKKTLNYSDVIKLIKKINSKNKFNLLETFCETLAIKILNMSPLAERVKIRVEKTSPPIKEELKSVGVEFEKLRDEVNYKRKDNEGLDDQIAAYLSIGSNIGDREKNLRKAVKIISGNEYINILDVSSIYETEPMYVKEQNSFYNITLSAGIIREKLTPHKLLGFLKEVEYIMGRESMAKRYGPRVIDIDILYFNNLKIESDFLTIPHPRIKERNFVLIPLSEISPKLKIDGKYIKDFIKTSSFTEKVKKIKSW